MKHYKPIRLLSLIFVTYLGMLQAPMVFAAAGDTISNRATLSYDVGAVPQTVIESAPGAGNSTPGVAAGTDTDFIEDRVINFSVAEVGGATTTVSPSATFQAQEYLITNNSNILLDFLLTGLNHPNGTADPHSASTDIFDGAAVQVFVETVNPGFNPIDDTQIFIDELAVLGTETVYVVATIPGTVTNGQVAVLSLVVQAAVGGVGTTEGAAIMRDDNGNVSPVGTYSNGGTTTVAVAASDTLDAAGAMDTVFNDPAGATVVDVDSTGLVQDIARNGQASDSDSYTVSAAELTVSKVSLAHWDPVNLNSNPKSIPGGYVQYTVTVANAVTAGASADLTTLADTLPATLLLDVDLITAAGGPGTPESAAGDTFRIDTSGTARLSAGTTYCTAAADADGCSHPGGVGGAISINYATEMPLEAGYTAGELKPNESVVVVFNVIAQ